MTEDGPDDSGSTLVRFGKSAMTFTEMAAFVRELEARPTDGLLRDLPGLLSLPDGQHGLVTMVLRKRIRPGSPERDAIVARLRELHSKSDDPAVRGRCKLVLDRPDPA